MTADDKHREEAEQLVNLLALSPQQAEILVAELRNRLVPSRHWIETARRRGTPPEEIALRGINAVLVLAAALAERAR